MTAVKVAVEGCGLEANIWALDKVQRKLFTTCRLSEIPKLRL